LFRYTARIQYRRNGLVFLSFRCFQLWVRALSSTPCTPFDALSFRHEGLSPRTHTTRASHKLSRLSTASTASRATFTGFVASNSFQRFCPGYHHRTTWHVVLSYPKVAEAPGFHTRRTPYFSFCIEVLFQTGNTLELTPSTTVSLSCLSKEARHQAGCFACLPASVEAGR